MADEIDLQYRIGKLRNAIKQELAKTSPAGRNEVRLITLQQAASVKGSAESLEAVYDNLRRA